MLVHGAWNVHVHFESRSPHDEQQMTIEVIRSPICPANLLQRYLGHVGLGRRRGLGHS